MASGFHRHLDTICVLLGYYTTYIGNSLPTCQYNIFVPSSRIKKCKKSLIFVFVGHIGTLILDLYFDVRKIRVLRKGGSHTFAVCGQTRHTDVVEQHRHLFLYHHWEGEQY
jgi:hypothetical protein